MAFSIAVASLIHCYDVSLGKKQRKYYTIHIKAVAATTKGQTLAKKILRYGYFWLTLNQHAIDFAKMYDKCQRFSKIPRLPPTELTLMVSPWSFVIWGIDLIRELPMDRWGAKYAIVVGDYFTKWAELSP